MAIARLEPHSGHGSTRSLPLLLLLVLSTPVSAGSQELPQPVVKLQFSYSDPGARSMGFGGAFVALADDATAAFANPAGLVQLIEPEVSLELRHWRYSTPFTLGGRLEGEPSGFGIDNRRGLATATSEADSTGVSFLSFAYPVGRWSIAFYRHQFADFEFFAETQGLFAGGTDCCQLRLLDQRTINDVDFVSHGLAGAYRVSERLSLGLGVTYFDVSLTAVADLYLVDSASLEDIFGPNSYLPERKVVGQLSSIDDTDLGLSGGFLWSPSERWRIGGVYRQGPEVETGNALIAGPAIDGAEAGEVLFTTRATVELPSAFGLGFAYRAPGDRLTVSFQWDRIAYSSIVDSLELDDQLLDDADELHLGGEYVFRSAAALVAVRLGIWSDPDHQLRANDLTDPFLSALQPPGDDELHWTAGVGVAFGTFQIDLGVDLSDRVDTAALSTVYSF